MRARPDHGAPVAALLLAAAFASALACSEARDVPSCEPQSGTYLACGCGCCGGVEPTVRCLAPEDDLCRIVELDRATAASPECATAGCAIGVEYRRCSN